MTSSSPHPHLPIENSAATFAEAINNHPVVIVSAPPGSGKTTMVPLFLREAFAEGEIWVVQPRRIAAVMAAHQVAGRLLQQVGEEVGYHIRFESVASSRTRIRFMTDGVFLRRLLEKRGLLGVVAVCLDEFHERSLAMDIGAWWFRRELSRGGIAPRLVVLSATIEREALIRYFPEAVWIDAPGQSHPVTIKWGDPQETRPLKEQVISAVRYAVEVSDGGILCFLPTVRSMEECARECASFLAAKSIDHYLLHGGLAVADQERAVRRGGRRRLVFATNVAESSITVEGVDCVIDSGLARMLVLNGVSGGRLSIDRISQAACVQRAGRAGREGPGMVMRLYSAFDFSLRRAAELPNVLTQDPTSLLLFRAALGASDVEPPLLEEPSAEARAHAHRLLTLWELIDLNGTITARGKAVISLPVEPRLGVLLLGGSNAGITDTVAWAAAILSSDGDAALSSPRQRGEAAGVDRQGCDLLGSIITARREGRGMVARVAAQLSDGCASGAGSSERDQDATAEALGRALVAAFPERVGVRRLETDEYLLATGERAVLSRDSRARGARLIVAVDRWSGDSRPGNTGVIITSATAIEEEWLFDIYPQLLSSRSSVEWHEHSARVERISESCFWAAPIEVVRRHAVVGDSEAEAILSVELRRRGMRWVMEDEPLETLLGRLELVTARGAPWEGGTVNEETLTGWVADFPHGCVSHRQLFEWFAAEGLAAVLSRQLDPRWYEILARWCPETIALANRPKTKIDYRPGRAPVVASRMQDFFGTTELPRIAGGSVPLRIHLLAPNGRTVQVTENLATFWTTHYPTLRRQLQSRYPKHRWPEDPTVALPPVGQVRRT